jgi:hypothetical protein
MSKPKSIESLTKEVKALKCQVDTLRELTDKAIYTSSKILKTFDNNILRVFIADDDVAIGHSSNWHKVVCNYDSNGRCLGGPRPHSTSRWSIDSTGYHLEGLELEDGRKWSAFKSELKYHQLPVTVIDKHHKAMVEHIKSMGIWYPAIFDLGGEYSSC